MKKDFNRIGATLCSSMRPRSSTTSWLNKFKLLALVLTTMLSINAWGADVTDVITQSCFSNVSSSGYNNYTYTGTSGADYLINFYQSSNTNMRFKKTTVSSGLVVTSIPSGKKIKSVTATFSNGLDIYWSNTVYGTNAIAKNTDETSNISLTSGTAKSPTSTATSFRLYSPGTAAEVSNITIVWTDAAPACAAPTSPTNGITTKNSQVVSWTSSESTFEVFCSTSSTDPASNATPTATVTAKTHTFTGLNANTTYYWWVRTKCSESSKSAWVKGTSFKTANITYTDLFLELKLPNFYGIF